MSRLPRHRHNALRVLHALRLVWGALRGSGSLHVSGRRARAERDRLIPLADLSGFSFDVPDASLEYAPAVSTTRDVSALAREVERLADLYWRAARARGLGPLAPVERPAIYFHASDRIGIHGLYRGPHKTLGGPAITISAGVSSWGDLVECLIHEIAHALEPEAAHGRVFRETLCELVDVIFGVWVSPGEDTADPYEIDHRLCAAFTLALPWADHRVPTKRPVFELLREGARRVADQVGAALDDEDLAKLEAACRDNAPGEYRVRGFVRVGDLEPLECAWKVRLLREA